MKRGKEYSLRSTGCWIISPSAQKVLNNIERRRNKKRHHKVQKKK